MNDPTLTPAQVTARLDAIFSARRPVAFDVEGLEWMTCCGFATSPYQRPTWKCPACKSAVEESTLRCPTCTLNLNEAGRLAGPPQWVHPAFVIDTLGLRSTDHSKAVWEALTRVLESPDVLKVCWNVGHERGFLQWAHSIHLRAYADAMFRWAERWPELPKRLKYAASILTRLPCWTEGISFKEEDEEAHATGPLLWRYNAMDCLATCQLWSHPQLSAAESTSAPLGTSSTTAPGLTPRQLDRYAFNLSLVEPMNWASQHGINYDQETRQRLQDQLTPQMWEAQAEVDALAGITLPEGEALLDYIRAHCCAKAAVKKGLVSDLKSAGRHALKAYRDPLEKLPTLLGQGTKAAQGEIASLLDLGLNVKSSGASSQVIACLNRLGLPPVFKRGRRKPNPDLDEPATPSQSKDQEALLSLFLRTGHPITTAILRVVALRGRLQELARKVSSDGRIRCSFTVGYGTETGRTTSHSWLDGTGGNLQTVPKEPLNFRVLYRADPGQPCDECYGTGHIPKEPCQDQYNPCPMCHGRGETGGYVWWKLDLTGADLWTVACRCASLGDRTMLDDLLAGIRIPSLVGLMLEKGYRPGKDRSLIRRDCLAYREDLTRTGRKWMDTTLKKGGHLTNYGGSAKRIRQTVIEDTYSETGTPFDPGLDLCASVRRCYLSRYWGLPLWWRDTAARVLRTGCLEMATGQVREFLARRPRHGKLDDETQREALAAEPQSVTTHICNLALHALWYDVENWPSGTVGNGDPVIQPLLAVHDELAGQCPADQRPFLVRKLRAAFDQPITIGRETIRMPFDGATGPSWGECKEKL